MKSERSDTLAFLVVTLCGLVGRNQHFRGGSTSFKTVVSTLKTDISRFQSNSVTGNISFFFLLCGRNKDIYWYMLIYAALWATECFRNSFHKYMHLKKHQWESLKITTLFVTWYQPRAWIMYCTNVQLSICVNNFLMFSSATKWAAGTRKIHVMVVTSLLFL